MVGLFLALQGWLVIGMFRWHDLNGNVERYRASMNTTFNLLESWREEADQVVVLTETNEAKYGPENQVMWWEVLGGYCLLYTSDAADDLLCVDLGGRRLIKKKKTL